MLTGHVTAQSFKTLYSFTGDNDGAAPTAGLILSNNTLYGTTELGLFDEYGDYGGGADIFAINADGTGFRIVTEFFDSPYLYAGVILSSNILYGTTAYGGTGTGSVFAVNTNGNGFTNLHSFTAGSGSPITNNDGAYLSGGLILLSNTLYGTAEKGGSSGSGTIFAVNTDGTGFTNLHSFTGSDGSDPYAGLIFFNNKLYGTTENGGGPGDGTIFAINTDGTGFTNLHNFVGGSHGTSTMAGLISSGNTVYGTTYSGGTGGNGAVFGFNTEELSFTNLYSFTTGKNITIYNVSNSDGAEPFAGLLLCGSTFYGTTWSGGSNAAGTIFAVNTDGTGFTNLHTFTGGNDGRNPYASLTLSGKILYGTASDGGSFGYGTVFSLSFAPQLSIALSGSNVILTWPTNVAGFDYTGYTLQCATNPVSPSWNAVSPLPVIVNGQETVTNPISGTQMFYRLSQ
jgi:uncharacterized repeat protein (TIGR03803 family)